MIYTHLNSTIKNISKIGFGCAAIGGYDYGPISDNESISAIHKSIDLGVNLFDVADVYGFGRAENILGKAIKGLSKENIFIATKVGVRWDANSNKTWRDLSAVYVEQAIDSCLKRLGVERLDICQMHWPINNVPPAEIIGVFEKIQMAGKINCIGVCNVSESWFNEAAKHCRIDSLQIPYSIFDKSNINLISSSHYNFGSGVFVYNILAHGLLSGKFNVNSQFSNTDLRSRVNLFSTTHIHRAMKVVDTVRFVANELCLSPSQVAISYALSTIDVTSVLVGVKSIEQAQCNFSHTKNLPFWAVDMINQSCEFNGF
jgi:aryl-alcohol dehydrogenase-like predicted oxidoreductase